MPCEEPRVKSSPSWMALVTLIQSALLPIVALPAFADEFRYVPQLGLTELSPYHVSFHPDDPQTLMVVNRSGRIDLLDVSNPDRPVKIQEIYAAAINAAFNPAGDRIVSASDDGTVRLWTLDGRAAADPFEGHWGGVLSVAFNPAGDRIVSAGGDGTVRLWTLDGRAAADPFEGHGYAAHSVAFNPAGDRIVSASDDGTVRLWDIAGRERQATLVCIRGRIWPIAHGVYAVFCTDRIVFLDEDLEKRGELFLHRDGFVTVTDEGVLAPSDELQLLVRGFGQDGTLLSPRGAVPEITLSRARQILLND